MVYPNVGLTFHYVKNLRRSRSAAVAGSSDAEFYTLHLQNYPIPRWMCYWNPLDSLWIGPEQHSGPVRSDLVCLVKSFTWCVVYSLLPPLAHCFTWFGFLRCWHRPDQGIPSHNISRFFFFCGVLFFVDALSNHEISKQNINLTRWADSGAVSRTEMALDLCNAMLNRWRRNSVERTSPVLLPYFFRKCLNESFFGRAPRAKNFKP